jgi:putative iron-regulated protein
MSLNAQGGETNIATGYHAIEFLLWGQDLSKDGPGDRPFTDYTTAQNSARRGEYLHLATELLVTNLTYLNDAWSPNVANFRADFGEWTGKEQLTAVLTGLIILSGFETGGERIQPALDSHDQEDEHSCFSDNTHRDFVQDVRGIQNVYLGAYSGLSPLTTVEGASPFDLVAMVDKDLADSLGERIATSLALAEDLKSPFDQEIASGNPAGNARVQALLDSLRAQEKLLEEVFVRFDLNVPVQS